MLFAVLLVTALSLTGIASASAADVGTAQKHTGNAYIVEKCIKTQFEDLKSVEKQTKTQKKVVNESNTVNKTVCSKNTTTQNVNISKSTTKSNNTVTKQATTKKYNVYKQYKYKKWYKYNGEWKYKWAYSYKMEHKYTSNSKYPYAAHGSTKTVKKSTKANTSSINSLARSITGGVSSQHQKGTKVFNWVRDNIRYSFYYNTKYGATGTLKYRKGNCADQAHLIVALARSSGLKARYVHAKAHFRSGHWYGHVWAQICVNGKWYTADPTSSRNSFGVARNWNSAKIKGIYYKLPF